jgi:large subunit ribosomal protein L20
MPRSVNHVASRARRKNLMKLAKGYFGRRTMPMSVVSRKNETFVLCGLRVSMQGHVHTE